MATWNELNAEVRGLGTTFDIVRRKYLRQLADRTGRNTVLLYSGWLDRPRHPGTSISDVDKIGLMTVAGGLDPGRGLDLVIHTPGGDTAATESIAHYLRSLFGTDIRAIVPQLALSAGTVLCCAARVVLMGRQSSLGPIDPQVNERPAHAVVEEFDRAGREMKEDPDRVQLWRPILEQYEPTMVGECEKAIAWSREVARDLLLTGMFADASDADAVVDRVLHGLIDHPVTKAHARHLPIETVREMGLAVQALEDDPALHDAVLSVHNAALLTFMNTPAYRLIENQDGLSFIQADTPNV